MATTSNIKDKLAKLQRNMAIDKVNNNQGKFKYRNIEDIYKQFIKACSALDMNDIVLQCDSEVKMLGNRFYVIVDAYLLDENSDLSNANTFIHAKGWAREDFEHKLMQQPQLTGASTTYAKKQALGMLFLIHEEDYDSMIPAVDFYKQHPQEIPSTPINENTALVNETIAKIKEATEKNKVDLKKLLEWAKIENILKIPTLDDKTLKELKQMVEAKLK